MRPISSTTKEMILFIIIIQTKLDSNSWGEAQSTVRKIEPKQLQF